MSGRSWTESFVPQLDALVGFSVHHSAIVFDHLSTMEDTLGHHGKKITATKIYFGTFTTFG